MIKVRNLGPGQHAEQCVRVPSSIEMEVTLIDANPDGFISTKGSGWVFKILNEWICGSR